MIVDSIRQITPFDFDELDPAYADFVIRLPYFLRNEMAETGPLQKHTLTMEYPLNAYTLFI